MRLDRFITLGLVKPVGRVFGRFSAFDAEPSTAERTLPVLMYHSISDDPEPAFPPYYKVCTSPQRFAEHMQWLAEAGWRGVTLNEGLAWLNGTTVSGERLAVGNPEKNLQEPTESTEPSSSNQQKAEILFPNSSSVPSVTSCKSSEEKLVAITFDDGFRDFHTEAFPALRQHGFTATMYLPTAFIGESRKQFKSRDCLTWGEVEELQQAGMEFGSHTVNHPTLVKLGWPEIEMELRESKITLERRLKKTVRAFAYPFAFPQENLEFTTTLVEKLKKLGYESCVTTMIGRARTGDNPFILKRLPANSCDDQSLLAAKSSGAYDWLSVPQALARRAKRSRNSFPAK